MQGEKIKNVTLNADHGSQVIIAGDHATVFATQNNGKESFGVNEEVVVFRNNKKENYIDNWNSRLFLHQDNNEAPMTLAESFLTPDYRICKCVDRIGFSSGDILDVIIDKFIQYQKTSTMLITGVPGIGKSSIISWLANQYKDDDKIVILRFRDWESEELKYGLLRAIIQTLHCKKLDLENFILVLDGFDEMKALNKREHIFHAFVNDIKDFDNFKCIITSRPAYIVQDAFQVVVELQEFDIQKVKDFYKIITGNVLKNTKKLESNLTVLGVPVILYMAIMSKVDISKNHTKPELYNRIFAERGGIFDRFFDGNNEYSKGSQLMRNSENIKCYLKFLRETAFKMFEKDNLSLSKDEYHIPELSYQGDTISVLEFPIKHLFENVPFHIEFIHKSIYEYFVSEYIYGAMNGAINNVNPQRKLASNFGHLLNKNLLSPEILEFLRYKIRNSDMKEEFEVVNGVFQLMLKNGMTFFTNRCFRNVIDCEMMVFANMLEVIHIFEKDCYHFDDSICNYLQYNKIVQLNLYMANIEYAKLRRTNLEGANLEGANLEAADLRGANLEESNLIYVNIESANLGEANLEGANLGRANLEGADLKGANLEGAKLRGANLAGVNLGRAKLRGANLAGANLERANLENANLRGANLEESNLEESNLIYGHLENANLGGADLEGANLEGTNLRGANLQGAYLRGANLNVTIFDERQIDYLACLWGS